MDNGDRQRRNSPPRRSGGGGGGGGGQRSSRRRSRSRDRGDRGGDRHHHRSSQSSKPQASAQDQQRLRELLLSEAAKRNPDAASILQADSSSAGGNQEALQRALATASSLTSSQHQQLQYQLQMQQQQQQHQQQYSSHQEHRPYNNSQRTDHRYEGRGGGDNRGGYGQQRNPPRQNDPERELHIGNIPEQIRDEAEFTKFLNEAAIQRHLNLTPGNPIISCRIIPIGRYSFALFRTKEEANKGMELNGFNCYGNALRVDRPRSKGANNPNMSSLGSNNNRPNDENQLYASLVESVTVPTFAGLSNEDLRQQLERYFESIGEATSLVELSNLEGATASDVEAEARRHGAVLGVRPSPPDRTGCFLVKMSTIKDAEKLFDIRKCFGSSKERVGVRFRPLTEWVSS